MNVRYRAELEEGERQSLTRLVAGGSRRVRQDQARANPAGGGSSLRGRRDRSHGPGRHVDGRSDETSVRRREFGGGPVGGADEPGGPRELSPSEEALLIAVACSTPPKGRATWTLALLADAMVELTVHPHLSRHTIGRRLQENALKPWQRKKGCAED